jgi:hypothetical protein
VGNTKIGRLTRKAYGYRDVEFIHLCIYGLWGQNTHSLAHDFRTNFADEP